MSTRRLTGWDDRPRMWWLHESYPRSAVAPRHWGHAELHTRSSHSAYSTSLPSPHFQKLQSASEDHKTVLISFCIHDAHLLNLGAEGVLSIGGWVGEVVEPVHPFIGQNEEVGRCKVDENRLGQVPLWSQLR